MEAITSREIRKCATPKRARWKAGGTLSNGTASNPSSLTAGANQSPVFLRNHRNTTGVSFPSCRRNEDARPPLFASFEGSPEELFRVQFTQSSPPP